MSMAIRTNVQALNASNSLKRMSVASETAARRVATGERINSAADDTVGMAISESMQNQTRGLAQAVRNIRDANAFFNIADGALQEASDMVKRINEIAIQASADTLTDEDRKLLDTEVSQLVQGVADVANNAEYGSFKIFAPDTTATTFAATNPFAGNQPTDQTLDLTVGGAPLKSMGVDMAKVISDYSGKDVFTTFNDLFDPDGSFNQAKLNEFFLGLCDGLEKKFQDENDTTTKVDGGIDGNGNINFKFSDASGVKTYDDLSTDLTTVLSNALGANGQSVASPFASPTDVKQFFVQKGANIGNGATFEWAAVTTELLTLDNAKVNPISEALSTQGKCNYALDYLSNIRSTMGAYTNRLEFSEQVADTSRINLSDANSRIKDADIAKEMMEYTRANVLTQAATNVLSMANQAPQRVLELLKAN